KERAREIRQTGEEQAVAADAKMAELKAAYAQGPDAQLRRDRADLERLRQSPTRHDTVHQEARIERQIASSERAVAQAEAAVAKTEAERIDAAMLGSAGAGPETTHGDQVPMRDLVCAVGDLLQTRIHPEMLEDYL